MILPVPCRCGNIVQLECVINGQFFYVRCDCGMCTGNYRDPERAIGIWNRVMAD